MNTKDLINKATSLPIEERALLADSLLKTLNHPESEIDKKWANIAQKRFDDIKSQKVESISGKEVFSKIWKRFDV